MSQGQRGADPMEIVAFVVALVLVVGVALLAFRRTPLTWRREPDPDRRVPDEARTAEPPGRVDDAG